MLTVACVLSPGPTYTREHVDRLSELVARYCTVPYRFVCVDDSQFPGWWAKISLFEPKRFTGQVLYLDLDVTIVGDLTDVIMQSAHFTICRDWLPTRRPDGGVFKSKFNSSVMLWSAGVAENIYTDFDGSVMERFPGDQDWIAECFPDAATFHPGLIVSYKADVLRWQVLHNSSRIVVYHGQPKSWDLPEDQLDQYRQ